jgi:lipid-A-disaccharide synthase
MPSVLFIAGDASGDAHAARVARELKALRPGVSVWAAGGPALREVADRFLADLVDQSVMGFWEPLKKIPFFRRFLRDTLIPLFRDEKPDLVAPVDFYGFNHFAARAAKAAGRKVYYFISPQVWASRPGRVAVLKDVVDRMVVIFPFEEEIYRRAGVPVTFVGHPLLDAVPVPPEERPLRVESVVGLLPGSRRGEVRRILPVLLETAGRLARARHGTRFVLFAAPSLPNAFYDSLLGDQRRAFFMEMVRDENYARRGEVDLALTCSGSATLENALLGVPMVVVYKTSPLTYLLARALVRVSHIAMPNLLAKEEIVPEKIQGDAAPAILAETALGLLDDAPRRRDVRRRLLSLRDLLGGPGASRRTAEILAGAIP